MMKADGFDKAIIGIASRAGFEDVIAYNWDKCVNVLQDRDGMSLEDAIEFMDFNVVGSYVGKDTPVFVRGMGPDELTDYGIDLCKE